MAGMTGKIALAVTAIALTGVVPVHAQQAPQRAVPQAGAPANPPPAAAPVQGAPAGPALTLPDQYKLNMMIRTAIIALNQANLTGNYTVLRDLGVTSFRLSNDASRLAEIFVDLRRRKIDLSPILFFMPKLVSPPQINERGLIRLVGYFETAPERINFDIYYAFEAGQWRLFGIGVLLKPPMEATAALPQQNGAPAQGAQGGPGQAAPVSPTAATTKPAPGEVPPRPAAVNTGRAAPKPAKASENAAPATAAKPEKTAVENKTTTNTARIRLGTPGAAPEAAAAPDAPAQNEAEAPASAEKPKEGLFGLW